MHTPQPCPAIPLLGVYLTEMNVISNQELEYSFLGETETSQMFVTVEWVNKLWYAHNLFGILYRNENEQTKAICKNMSEYKNQILHEISQIQKTI